MNTYLHSAYEDLLRALNIAYQEQRDREVTMRIHLAIQAILQADQLIGPAQRPSALGAPCQSYPRVRPWLGAITECHHYGVACHQAGEDGTCGMQRAGITTTNHESGAKLA